MSLLWMEGFDHNYDEVALARVYTGANTSLSGDLVSQGGATNRVNVTTDIGAASSNAVLHSPVVAGSTQGTWIMGFAFRAVSLTSINTGSIPYIALRNTSGEQCRIEFVEEFPASTKPGGLYYKIRLMRGVTELCSSNELFEMSIAGDKQWLYFQFTIVINDTTGSIVGRYEYPQKPSRTGGTHVVMTWDAANTSLDTQDQGTTGADQFEISFATGGGDQVAFDDMYFCDNTGGFNDAFLGRCIVTTQSVTATAGGDGDTTSWSLVSASDTADALDEPANGTEDDTRLTSDTTGQIHLATMDSLVALDQATILGVAMEMHGRMDTTGSLNIGFMWRKTTATAAQIEFGTALAVASTTVVGARVIAEEDPNTLAAWTFANLDVTQYGVINKV